MASCDGRKSESDERRDVISQLPIDVKERILECLDTRNAARTVLLSTHWKDVWLRHGRLVFDYHFFYCFRKCKSTDVRNIINDILLLHIGPIKKFTLEISGWTRKPRQSDLDRWSRFLTRNGVQELHFCLSSEYMLPSCIVSCQTIKLLSIRYFCFHVPINAGCIFPGITSLFLHAVLFTDNFKGIVYCIPNLEELFFRYCEGINNFEISAPKLKSFSAFCFTHEPGWKCFTPHLQTIESLTLKGLGFSCESVEVAAMTFPIAINLQAIQLHSLSFYCAKQITFAMELLRKSPNLCKLEITLLTYPPSYHDINDASRLLEDPESCIVNQDWKMLNTIKILSFHGSKLEMLFVKMLLSKSPALERVVIQESSDIDASMAVRILRELLHFTRASPKAQIICMEYK